MYIVVFLNTDRIIYKAVRKTIVDAAIMKLFIYPPINLSTARLNTTKNIAINVT